MVCKAMVQIINGKQNHRIRRKWCCLSPCLQDALLTNHFQNSQEVKDLGVTSACRAVMGIRHIQ
jgi:hypothetical protein